MTLELTVNSLKMGGCSKESSNAHSSCPHANLDYDDCRAEGVHGTSKFHRLTKPKQNKVHLWQWPLHAAQCTWAVKVRADVPVE